MVSLGCPKNTVDSERVLGDLVTSGFDLTQDEKDADVIIVNTCGFIESAKKESIDTILEMARHKTEGNCKQLIVTGCLAERYGQELLDEIPEIDHMLGVGQYPQLKSIIEDVNPSTRNHVATPAEFYESYTDRLLTTAFYTAYLKISEGCSNRCAFCIIPKMRGPMRCSRREDPLGAPICTTQSTSPQSTPRSRLAVQTSARNSPRAMAPSTLRRAQLFLSLVNPTLSMSPPSIFFPQ